MTNKNHILKLIKGSVKTADPHATLVLYGSYARSDNDESDIGLLIPQDKETATHDGSVKMSYPLYDTPFGMGVLISPIVLSRQLWENKYMVTRFYENVNKEG